MELGHARHGYQQVSFELPILACGDGYHRIAFMPAALALIATVHAEATRSRALAIFATAQFAGIFAGGWYGGWMADHLGWRVGCNLLSGLGVCYAAVLRTGLPRQNVSAKTSTRSARVNVLSSRCAIALCGAFFTFCAMLWILLPGLRISSTPVTTCR